MILSRNNDTLNKSDLNIIWKNYKENGSIEDKNKLITYYARLIKPIAQRVNISLGYQASVEDLESDGIFGLIDAIEKYDLNANNSFETYAAFRIKGAIIDEVRRKDWYSRHTRMKFKAYDAALVQIEDQNPTISLDEKRKLISKKMNVDISEIYKIEQQLNNNKFVSLEEYLEIGNDVASTNNDCNPEIEYLEKEQKEVLIKALENLFDNERQIISLYYYNELTFTEIAKIMGISESRISVVHKRAITKLKLALIERFNSH